MQESYMKIALGQKTPCWIWQGMLNQNGYGMLGSELAHRVFYERANGKIQEGLEIHHLCKIRSCVNPDHLIALTFADHMTAHRMMGVKERRKRHKTMKRQPKGKNTVVTSFRILRNQHDTLKQLPQNISASVVVRTLLQEYLSGNLPQIHSLVIAEATRTQEAVINSKF